MSQGGSQGAFKSWSHRQAIVCHINLGQTGDVALRKPKGKLVPRPVLFGLRCKDSHRRARREEKGNCSERGAAVLVSSKSNSKSSLFGPITPLGAVWRRAPGEESCASPCLGRTLPPPGDYPSFLSSCSPLGMRESFVKTGPVCFNKWRGRVRRSLTCITITPRTLN